MLTEADRQKVREFRAFIMAAKKSKFRSIPQLFKWKVEKSKYRRKYATEKILEEF